MTDQGMRGLPVQRTQAEWRSLHSQETLETYGYHQMGYVTGVSGNRLYVSQELNAYSLGLNSIRFVYKYSRGTLVPASKYGSYTSTRIP